MKVDIDPETLSGVVGKIYDSAIDPALWPMALQAACDLVGGTFAYIGLFNTHNRTLNLPFHWGGNAEMIRSYETLVPLQPFWDVMTQYQIGQIATTDDLMQKTGLTEDQVMNSPFFKQWARPNALRDVVAGIVINAEGRVGSINLHTPATRDVVGPRDIAVMELLLPHARRAVTIGDLLDMKSLAAAAFDATLNALTSAVVLVDSSGRVLQANQAAQNMFSAGGPILCLRDELATHQPDATNALRAAIGHAATDESELGYGGIGVPVQGGRQDAIPSIAHVLPLKSGKLRPGLSLGAVAAVFVTPAHETAAPPVEALAALYDLTPTEARVMIEIASGKNRAATAAVLGIADSTVKTHLARVFEKTGTAQQSELARLVASLTPPVTARPKA
jgi:DNA-binding CsgD family transcriptional regulator/PAS domain-containing protein